MDFYHRRPSSLRSWHTSYEFYRKLKVIFAFILGAVGLSRFSFHDDNVKVSQNQILALLASFFHINDIFASTPSLAQSFVDGLLY